MNIATSTVFGKKNFNQNKKGTRKGAFYIITFIVGNGLDRSVLFIL